MTAHKFTHPDYAKPGHKWVTDSGVPAISVTAFKVTEGNIYASIVAVVNDELHVFDGYGNVIDFDDYGLSFYCLMDKI